MTDRVQASREPSRMVQLLSRLAVERGVRPSSMPNVKLMRADRSIPRSPALYDPSIVVIAQGRKLGFLGERAFTYDRDHFLLLAIPLPFECQTHAAANGQPMLGVSIRMDVAVIAELLAKMPEQPPCSPDASARAIRSAPLDAGLREATVRLLETLADPDAAAVLGAQCVREVTYRALRGEHGEGLRALAAKHSRLARFRRVLDQIQARFADPFDIAALAKAAGMSPSAFHHHFRALTETSPLQYVKSIRLHEARMLLVYERVPAAEAAARVGYESASQFSREFKRLFGRTPSSEAAHMRELLGLDGATSAKRR